MVQVSDLLVIDDEPPPSKVILQQIVTYFRLSRATVKQRVNQGKLKEEKMQGRWWFDWNEL